jgi:hypothetical protein
VAGAQLQNSDVAYVGSQYGQSFFSNLGISFVPVLLLLLWIWWPYLKKAWAALTAITLACLIIPGASFGYYDKVDLAEVIYIRPNWSVFWVPDVGATLDSQGKMDTEEFFEKNKVPAKRFEIKHTKLAGSTGMLERDYYVPAGRLYVVERTPYNRRWTGSTKTGTSARDQAIRCQDKNGLNVTVELTVSATILDKQAAAYLSWWGTTLPSGKEAGDPAVIFASCIYARPLAAVMDEVVFGVAQAFVFEEVSKRTLDQANAEANIIMTEVRKKTEDFCTKHGITLLSMGAAGTFSFDNEVQQAINQAYMADKVKSAIPVLQTKAMIDATYKWDGKLPGQLSVWWFPFDMISNLFQKKEGK